MEMELALLYFYDLRGLPFLRDNIFFLSEKKMEIQNVLALHFTHIFLHVIN